MFRNSALIALLDALYLILASDRLVLGQVLNNRLPVFSVDLWVICVVLLLAKLFLFLLQLDFYIHDNFI